jgi:hypothetical protein
MENLINKSVKLTSEDVIFVEKISESEVKGKFSIGVRKAIKYAREFLRQEEKKQKKSEKKQIKAF